MNNFFGFFWFILIVFLEFKVAAHYHDHRPAHHYHHGPNPPSPIIHTHTGRLRGMLVDVAPDLQTYEFTGIPYAEPPIDHRRFEKPEHKHRWHHLFHADRPAKMCPQTLFPGRFDIDLGDRYYLNAHDQIHTSEDCLTLSIWAPKEKLDEHHPGAIKLETIEAKDQSSSESHQHHHHNRKLSVLAFFHTGTGYGGGNVTPFDGRYLAAYNDIIVVTIRYRVGLLGFAHRHGIHSNLGLWDQVEALRWIHENIHHFGGDKHNVTIAGQGFSSTLVSLHLLSHRSRRYFHRAIVESNTAISQPLGVLYPHTANNITDYYFKPIIKSYCYRQENLIECLKHVPVEVFVKALATTNNFKNRLPLMLPVIDGHFVRHDPYEMIHHHNFYKIPLLIGVNKDEGAHFVAFVPKIGALLPLNSRAAKTRPTELFGLEDYERFTRWMRNFYLFMMPLNTRRFHAARLHYWPSTEDNGFPTGNDLASGVSTIFGDVAITCPAFEWAEKTAHEVHHVFAYQFSHMRTRTWALPWMGTPHGSELPYVFGEPLSPKAAWLKYDDDDRTLSQIMMTYWTNFVKHGDPNGKSSEERLLPQGEKGSELRYWPRLKSHQGGCRHRFFDINAATLVKKTKEPVVCRLKEDDCSFWHKYLPKLGVDHHHDSDAGSDSGSRAHSSGGSFQLHH